MSPTDTTKSSPRRSRGSRLALTLTLTAAAAAATAAVGLAASDHTAEPASSSHSTSSSHPAPSSNTVPAHAALASDTPPAHTPPARVPAPAQRASTSPRQVPAPVAGGSVPSGLVGLWSGGPDDETRYLLKVFSDGSYARAHAATGAVYEIGTLQIDGQRWTTIPRRGTNAPPRTATWDYTNANGILVVSVSDPLEGSLSFVPASLGSGRPSSGTSSNGTSSSAGALDGGSDSTKFDPKPPSGPFTPGS